MSIKSCYRLPLLVTVTTVQELVQGLRSSKDEVPFLRKGLCSAIHLSSAVRSPALGCVSRLRRRNRTSSLGLCFSRQNKIIASPLHFGPSTVTNISFFSKKPFSYRLPKKDARRKMRTRSLQTPVQAQTVCHPRRRAHEKDQK